MSRSSYRLPWTNTDQDIGASALNTNNISQTHRLGDQQNGLITPSEDGSTYAKNNSLFQPIQYYQPSTRSTTTLSAPQNQTYQKQSFTSPVSLSKRIIEPQRTGTGEQGLLDQQQQQYYQLPQFNQQTPPRSYEYPLIQQQPNSPYLSDQRTRQIEASLGTAGVVELEPQISRSSTIRKYEYPMTTNNNINTNLNATHVKDYSLSTIQHKDTNKQINNDYTTFYPKRPRDDGLFEVNDNSQDKMALYSRYPQNATRYDNQQYSRVDEKKVKKGLGGNEDNQRHSWDNQQKQQQQTEELAEYGNQQLKETGQSSQWSQKKSFDRHPNSHQRFEDTLRVYDDVSPSKNQNKISQQSPYGSSKRNRSHTKNDLELKAQQNNTRDWLKQMVMQNESDTEKGLFSYESFQQLCLQLGFSSNPQFSSQSSPACDTLWNLLQHCCPSSSGKVSTQLLYQILQLIADSSSSNRYDSGQAVALIKTICLKHRSATISATQLLGSNEEESTVLSALIRSDIIDNLRDQLKQPAGMKDIHLRQNQHHQQFHSSFSSHSNETHYVRTQLTEKDDYLPPSIGKSPQKRIKNDKILPGNIHTHGLHTPIRSISREQYLQEESVHRRLFCDAGAKVNKLTDYLAAKDRIATQQMAQCTFKPVINKNTQRLLGRSKSFTNQIKNYQDRNTYGGIASRSGMVGQENTDGSVIDTVKGARDTLRRMEIARKQKEYRDNFWENERNKYNRSSSKRMKKRAMEASRFNDYSDNEGDDQDYDDYDHGDGDDYHNDGFSIRQNALSNRKISPAIQNRTLRRNSNSPTPAAIGFPSPQTTQRYPPRQSAPRDAKLQRTPMLHVDVNISKHRSCKIAIYEGDQPEAVAEEFAKIYSLQDKAKKKLAEKLADVLEQFYASQNYQP